jgi:hypothetical protein
MVKNGLCKLSSFKKISLFVCFLKVLNQID